MNKQLVFSGHNKTPLSKKGHEQAKKAGQQAKAEGLSFDIIVSSPLQRAHHTAKHIASAVGYPHKQIELNDLFKERYYGELEGGQAKSILGAKYYFDESSVDHFDNIEKLQELQDRATRALNYLKSLDQQTVLVVGHGAIGRALYRSIHDLPITKRDIRYRNAELAKFI